MKRLLALSLLAAAGVAATTSPASAAEHCRPGAGEHQLARSAQAVVLERVVKRSGSFPRQTIVGCSRRSGHRRTLDTLQRNVARDPTRLIGLRLAGTRVAYLRVLADVGEPRTVLIADDALHGGRRHDLSGGWPFGSVPYAQGFSVSSWAVDAQGDVAWITDETATGQALGVWRAGLGRRQVDAHAGLGDLALHDGVLRWRRDGAPRVVDLTALPPSRCGALRATVGTLEVDLVRTLHDNGLTACLRSTGRTVTIPDLESAPEVADVSGPYIVLYWMHAELTFTTLVDLEHGTWTDKPGGDPGMVVDEHGSRAWLSGGQWVIDGQAKVWYPAGLWVDDAAGPHKVADLDPTTPAGPLLRDGSTVTRRGGPTVTLNP
jgi:hypothetical protein